MSWNGSSCGEGGDTVLREAGSTRARRVTARRPSLAFARALKLPGVAGRLRNAAMPGLL
ncbi:MAG TPA: hypothetical protein VKR06_28835 [Ktedonosporobacter sp.]|nr:hypothetical protein [Ktedonosporobacter sp.]